jgi:hypothetical protein
VQTLDLNAILISSTGERHPCKLIHVSDKGYIEINSIDDLKKDERYQLVMQQPHVRTRINITSIEMTGDAYHVEAVPEEPAVHIQAKIIEMRVRGLMK